MALTVATILSRARELYRDTSMTNPGVSDAILIDRINDYYNRLANVFQRRPRSFAHGAAANWSATSVAVGTTSINTVATDILEFLAIHREATDGPIAVGPRLERLAVHRILELQRTDATGAAPTKCSLERIGTNTVASMGIWRVRYHPIPDTSYFFSAITLNEPQTLTTTTQAPDLTNEEAYIIAHLVAADGALLTRREAQVREAILEAVPERILRALGRAAEIPHRKRPVEQVA